jgi:hypothetical protein
MNKMSNKMPDITVSFRLPYPTWDSRREGRNLYGARADRKERPDP